MRTSSNASMNLLQSAVSLGLAAVLTLSSGCRRSKRTVSTPPEPPPAAAETSTSEPAAAPAVSVAPQNSPVTASVETIETSTEFEDLAKEFQLYCEYKGRVPTDINEFFREKKIRPPALPPGVRLAIDPVGRRIILVK